MIDYYLHKHCPLTDNPTSKQKENIRCVACVWLDKELSKCVFSLKYPKSISVSEFKERVSSVNDEQQVKLSEPFRRFVLYD